MPRFNRTSRARRIFARWLALGLVLSSLSACSLTSGTDAGVVLVSGTYQLATVNGQPLPWTQQATSPVIKLTESQLVASNDGSFIETTTRSTTTSSGTTTATVVTSGTYSVGGQVVAFTSSNSGLNGLGSYNAGNLVVQSGSALYEYAKL
ncbi:MAG: hypothetical protein JWL95_324 [Gemmatimonadetes bacterium]|nr:hypothetical protein [Gemmatimonadota bacterium]